MEYDVSSNVGDPEVIPVIHAHAMDPSARHLVCHRRRDFSVAECSSQGSVRRDEKERMLSAMPDVDSAPPIHRYAGGWSESDFGRKLGPVGHEYERVGVGPE